MPASPSEPPVFEALIKPYRSLTKRGHAAVIGTFLFFTAAFALRFWLIGAWPVIIFGAIEIPIVLALFAINSLRARASEFICVTAGEFMVVRTDGAGRQCRTTMSTAWLRVDLQDAHGTPHVVLRSRGRGYEVGAFLHEPEKRSLYESLQTALHRVRQPIFHNPRWQDT